MGPQHGISDSRGPWNLIAANYTISIRIRTRATRSNAPELLRGGMKARGCGHRCSDENPIITSHSRTRLT